MSGITGSLQTVSASNGWYYTASTSEITVRHNGLVVVGDSVITTWTAKKASGDETMDLVAYFNIGSLTLTTDFPPLIIPDGFYSESITIGTNGGVCLLR